MKSAQNGFVSQLKAQTVGIASMLLGAGRETKDSEIDLGAGIVLHKKVGDTVAEGEPLATLFTNKESLIAEAANKLGSAYSLSSECPAEQPLIYGVV